MTSASVKDLSSIMTFVNTNVKAQNSNAKSGMNFGDVMTKAEGNQTKTDIGSSNAQNSKTEKSGFKDSISKVEETAKTGSPKKIDGPQKTSEKNDVVSEESVEKLEQAGNELVAKVADELNVSEEEVAAAMEVLGLSVISLLDPANMTSLVLEVSGESDPMTLVTNEDLFNSVQNLTAMVDATIGDLAADMDMEVSKIQDMINTMDVSFAEEAGTEAINEGLNADMEMSVETNSDQKVNKDPAPKFTAEISTEGSTGENSAVVETDENGNVVKTVTVNKENESDDSDSEKSLKDNHQEKAEGQSLAERGEQGISFKNPILDNQINQTEATATTMETTSFVSEETTRIMDQILDHIKVNNFDDMKELEMQLHPASLGNVKVNLVSRAGEITAEFKVQNEQVKAAVEAQLNELRETFKASGAKVTAVEVSVEMQSFDSNLWQGKGHETGDQPGGDGRRRTRRISLDELEKLFADEDASEEDILAAQMLEATGGTVDFTA